MDVHSVSITQKDIDLVAAEVSPALAAGVTIGDACTVYKAARPILMIAITILQIFYKPGALAVTSVVAILDTACK